MNKIIIVADDLHQSKGVCYDLIKGGMEPELCSLSEFLSHADNIQNSTFVLDITDQNLQKKETLLPFKKISETCLFFVLSYVSDECAKLEAFSAGADDYIEKPYHPKELTLRIRNQMKRIEKQQDPVSTKDSQVFLNIYIDEKTRTVKINSKPLLLTKKEFDLLNFFLKNRNRVLSREYIQESLWKDEYPKQSRIVDVHTLNLRTNLKNYCANATIGSRGGIGYILEKKK